MATSLKAPRVPSLFLQDHEPPLDCEDDEPTVPVALLCPTSRDTPLTAGVESKHGGSAVRVGAHTIELVPYACGEIHAYVEPSGLSHEIYDMTAEVAVAGGRRLVDLLWNRAYQRYEGNVARGKIVAGPMSLLYALGRALVFTRVPSCPLAPPLTVMPPTAMVDLELDRLLQRMLH